MTTGDRLAVPLKPNRKRVEDGDRAAVQSLLRAIDLLELLASEPEGLRLVDIAERTGIPTSTVHRLLTTLEGRHFACLDKDDHCWTVGRQCFTVGAAFGRRRNLTALAMPVMRRLRDRSEQTVNLALTDLHKMTLLCQVPGRDLPQGVVRPGAEAPITLTALGQSVIAALSEAEMAGIVRGAQRASPSPRLVKETTLADTIRATRLRRFAIDDEVNAVGLRCVAAPIFNEFARPIGALSIAGASRHIEITYLGEIGRVILHAAEELTRMIGGGTPIFC